MIANLRHEFTEKSPGSKLEAALSLVIDREEILSFSRTKRKLGYTPTKQYTYTWVDSYARTLDKICNAIIVLVALITGMRAREVFGLTLDDVYADDQGEYWINITRFKTTPDPNYQGETEAIPLPNEAKILTI